MILAIFFSSNFSVTITSLLARWVILVTSLTCVSLNYIETQENGSIATTLVTGLGDSQVRNQPPSAWARPMKRGMPMASATGVPTAVDEPI